MKIMDTRRVGVAWAGGNSAGERFAAAGGDSVGRRK